MLRPGPPWRDLVPRTPKAGSHASCRAGPGSAALAADPGDGGGVSDDLVERLKAHFSEAEIVELTLAIAAYNLTNRFNLALGVDLEPKFEEILASAGIRV